MIGNNNNNNNTMLKISMNLVQWCLAIKCQEADEFEI